MKASATFAPAKQLASQTSRGKTLEAVKAVATIGRERTYDSVSWSIPSHFSADGYDLTNELMPHDRRFVETGLSTVVHMQIGSTNTCQIDPHNRVAC
jgi:hypothetical protein